MRSRGGAEEVQRIRAAHIVSPCRARKPKGNPSGDYGCGQSAVHDHRALPFRAVVSVFSNAWDLRSTRTTMPSIRALGIVIGLFESKSSDERCPTGPIRRAKMALEQQVNSAHSPRTADTGINLRLPT